MATRYYELKKRCGLVGCHCPPEHEVLGKSANTPMWMRLWFAIKTEDYKKKV